MVLNKRITLNIDRDVDVIGVESGSLKEEIISRTVFWIKGECIRNESDFIEHYKYFTDRLGKYQVG
jgi:hypothetical protein|tara:strand:+ start:101 stop:298 length:198 start_codon:yes stop_codon:yes gene_type:complete